MVDTKAGCWDLEREPDRDEDSVLDALQPGDHLEAWEDQTLHYTGTVDEVAPALGVVWIREAGLGLRKMLSVHQYRLRTGDPALPSDHEVR